MQDRYNLKLIQSLFLVNESFFATAMYSSHLRYMHFFHKNNSHETVNSEAMKL